MKNSYAIVLALCCAVAVTVDAKPTSRIVGGTDADDGKYPYQVLLRYGAMILCGGSILNKHYILTAAHCVYNRKPKMVTIATGTNDVTGKGGQYYFASELIPHQNFTSMDIEDISDDIALIRVEGEIEFNEKVQPISLPTSNFESYSANNVATLTGWGRTHENAANSLWLQEIELLVIPPSNCKNSWKQLQDSQICTITRAGEGACSGDSGGPLVSSGVQIGIVSFGEACARGIPDVYTRVFSYLDWINEHME